MEKIIGIIITIFVIVIVFKIARAVLRKKGEQLLEQKYEQALLSSKADYDAALQGKDKRDALEKGRIYYSYLRGGIASLAIDYSGSLSSEDEQRINNDISAMNI